MPEVRLEIERLEKDVIKKFLRSLNAKKDQYLLRNELQIKFKDYIEEKAPDKSLEDLYATRFLKNVQELIIHNDVYIFVYRYEIAKYVYYRLALKPKQWLQLISIEEYLRARDAVIIGYQLRDDRVVTIDFLPFYDYSPQIKDSKYIGSGIQYLNRYLSSSIFQKPNEWNELLFHFLQIHSMEDQQLLINRDKIKTVEQMLHLLSFMIETIENTPKDRPERVFSEMEKIGFVMGWGNTVERVCETMNMLIDCFHIPDADRLEKFISRIPMVSKIAILSPHGWFGQKGVLGRPDTGGQVVYILDKVKYLEKTIRKSLKLSGINIQPKILIITRLIPNAEGTTCDQVLEKVQETDNCWIYRVPFRHADGTVHKDWISRFHIWPYLETFADDVRDHLIKEFGGRPDLLVGNYSDGNLVATMLSQELDVMQCNIAHALEKSKYIFSDLYWEKMEDKYNFSFQYTADLLAMNMASFVITSTFQEIGGTHDSLGQYESYLRYSLPNLYQVKNGVNLFHPKFNVVPPGVPETVFFSWAEKQKRNPESRGKLEKILFEETGDAIFGKLADASKFPIFSMARIDKVKNISGLIEMFGQHEALRKVANLILITDKIRLEQSKDEEEQFEIKKIYKLIEKYHLESQLRWVGIGASASRKELGEVYRIMADHRGIFVQPALFEAFGLTVLEAMASGLPTFATQFGGPSEIIEDGESGFLINPTVLPDMFEKIYTFFTASQANEDVWKKVSTRGVQRVKKHFNWTLYCERLLSLTRLYGFWKFAVSKKAKEKMKLYYDVIFDDFYRKRLPKEDN